MNLIELAPKEAIQKAIPLRTSSYTPVANIELLDVIQDSITGRGLEIKGTSMSLAGNGNQFMGTIQLMDKTDGEYNTELGMQLGFRNSYNKSFAVGFGTGAEVFVCK